MWDQRWDGRGEVRGQLRRRRGRACRVLVRLLSWERWWWLRGSRRGGCERVRRCARGEDVELGLGDHAALDEVPKRRDVVWTAAESTWRLRRRQRRREVAAAVRVLRRRRIEMVQPAECGATRSGLW